MTRPAIDLPLTPRERLRLRRALDAQLIDDIFGRALRDDTPVAAFRQPPQARPRTANLRERVF